MNQDSNESLRFDDVSTFLTVHRLRSISAAARQLQVTPSQVSKAVARLERFVGHDLLSRGARGVSVTLGAMRTIPVLEDVARRVHDLRTKESEQPVLRVATSSAFAVALAGELAHSAPQLRLQFLETDSARVRAFAASDLYDVALLAGPQALGDLFSSEPVGPARSALFARPSLARALGPAPVSPARLRDVPFVMPVILQDGHVASGKDDCPLSFEERIAGHAAQTFSVALELASSSDQVVFGPEFTARAHVATGRLVEVPVEGWDVRWTLHLACHTERVRATSQRALRGALERWLGASAEAAAE